MGSLGQTLRETVRRLAYNTNLDQLRKRGVDRVSVLGMDRIAYLIEEAVKRSLNFKLMALDREEVARDAKKEFMRLLQSNQALEREHDDLRRLKEQAESQVDALRRELAEQKQALAKKLLMAEKAAQIKYEGEDRSIAKKLNVILEGLLSGSGAVGDGQGESADTSDFRSRVLDLVMEVVNEARREAIEAREEVRDREVKILQRRIGKLHSCLEDTEHRFKEISALKSIDQGVSSVFKEVQGLHPEDSNFASKQALMTSIFEDNLALRKEVEASRKQSEKKEAKTPLRKAPRRALPSPPEGPTEKTPLRAPWHHHKRPANDHPEVTTEENQNQ